MIRIAIVEDDKNYSRQFQEFIKKYIEETGEKFDVSVFEDGNDIAWNYNSNFDVIFMDVQMKKMDGMSAARSIRKVDSNVLLIFITNMAQYAIQGYEVDAMNYVLKPVNYFAFSQQLAKAVKQIKAKADFYISILHESSMVRLDINIISYIESQGHTIIYHTEDGDYATRDTLKNVEQKLEGRNFSRCNNCYLVNLKHVEKVQDGIIVVLGQKLQMSRMKRKGFMADLASYVGGVKG